jgi:hypothetical protein
LRFIVCMHIDIHSQDADISCQWQFARSVQFFIHYCPQKIILGFIHKRLSFLIFNTILSLTFSLLLILHKLSTFTPFLNSYFQLLKRKGVCQSTSAQFSLHTVRAQLRNKLISFIFLKKMVGFEATITCLAVLTSHI